MNVLPKPFFNANVTYIYGRKNIERQIYLEWYETKSKL